MAVGETVSKGTRKEKLLGTVRMDGSHDAAQRTRWQRNEGQPMTLFLWSRLFIYRLDTMEQVVGMRNE